MSRIDDLIARLCPGGVTHVPMGSVGSFVRGSGIQKKDLIQAGVGAMHYGEIFTHYGTLARATKSFISPTLAARARMATPGALVIATTSENDKDVCKAVAWLGNEPIAVSSDAMIYQHSLDPSYVAYYFLSRGFQTQKSAHISGTKVRRVSADALAKILIPVPPIEVQREVVGILDTFSELQAELEAELVGRQFQYAHLQRRLLCPRESQTPRVELRDIGRVMMCKRVFKDQTTPSGEVPFYKIGTFGGVPDAYISQALYLDYRARYPFPRRGDVLLSAAGTIGRTVEYDGAPAYFQDSNIVWLDNDESLVLNRYLFHQYQIMDWSTDGGTIRRLYNENLLRARVPLPPRAEQEHVIETLDAFESLVNDLSMGLPAELAARRKQYEYYRDKLLTFEEAT